MSARAAAPAVDVLSQARARRIALAAQGFGMATRARPPSTVRALDRVLACTQLIQIDSVNVLARAHYLPVYSRLGPYPQSLLDRAATPTRAKPARLFEYWAHEASYLPVELQPYLRFRMARARTDAWGGVRRLAAQRPDLIRRVKAEIDERGPITARELQPDGQVDRSGWGWNWSSVKTACEWLFFTGEVCVAGRTSSFERRYARPEQVLPAQVLARPTPTDADAVRVLVERAARAHGVASAACLRDYFRLGLAEAATAIDELVEAGTLLPVSVEGWKRPAYLHRDAPRRPRIDVATLLSPFDPLIWERARTQVLFDFSYRLEIYVPAHKRVHGYYVLPFLLGDQLVARVDLKADRAGGTLRVLAAHPEPAAPEHTAAALALELRRLGDWLGLDDVAVADRGELAAALAGELAA